MQVNTSDITVPSGKTLSLSSGVTIKMAEGKETKVQGSLSATGTSNNKLIFKNKDANFWNGIKIDNADDITVVEKYPSTVYAKSSLIRSI